MPAGLPIAAPSANLFTRPSPTTAQHVLDDLDGRVEIILDGGPTTIGLESTVVDMTQDPPRLLRPGGTPAEALLAHVPNLVIPTAALVQAEHEPAAGPGMLLKHYSPHGRVLLLAGFCSCGLGCGCSDCLPTAQPRPACGRAGDR